MKAINLSAVLNEMHKCDTKVEAIVFGGNTLEFSGYTCNWTWVKEGSITKHQVMTCMTYHEIMRAKDPTAELIAKVKWTINRYINTNC